MSGWPWMKNAKVVDSTTPSLEATPSFDDTTEDHRPLLKDLFSEYRLFIDQLQDELSKEDLYDAKKHDDLWMLRFLISHKKNVEKALEAAKTTLAFRHKLNLDENDIRAIPPQDREHMTDFNEAFQRFVKSGVGADALTLVVPEKQRHGVIFYFNIASIDTHALAEVDEEDYISGMCYINEWQFQWNDYLSRTTGRLTKSTHIIDVAGINIKMYDRTTQEKYVTACRTMSDSYPQGVQAYLVCHAPFWIETPWKVLKSLLPARVVQKLDFLNPKKSEKDLKRLLQYTPEKLLPERFGGQNEVWPPVFTPE